MKDIEKLKELLNGWDVPFKEEEKEIILGFNHTMQGITITVGSEDPFDIPTSPRVTGYAGFHTIYLFTSEGDFVSMGAWE